MNNNIVANVVTKINHEVCCYSKELEVLAGQLSISINELESRAETLEQQRQQYQGPAEIISCLAKFF